jgi:hypothetical protein
MTEKTKNTITTIFFWLLTAALFAVVTFGCTKTKEVVKTEYQKVVLVDSTYKERFDSLSSVQSKEVFVLREQVKTLNSRVASLSSGSTGTKDTAIPVKDFRVQSGESYFEMKGQWISFRYEFYVDSCVSKTSFVKDSASILDSFYVFELNTLKENYKELREANNELIEKSKEVKYRVNYKVLFYHWVVIALLLAWIFLSSKIKSLFSWL